MRVTATARPPRNPHNGWSTALLAIPIVAVIQIVLNDWWANRGRNSPAAATR